ncbi:MAG: hypothetical protein ABR508_00755 [Candidatus Baltobacteraceae bacterium]
MFLKVDGTFWIQLINFAIFFAILRVVFLRTVGKAIAERRAYIEGLTGDYERLQAEAAAARTQAEHLRAAARREAEAVLARARADASNRAAAIASDFNAKASAEVERAHETVNAELQAARASQPQAVNELANLVLARTLAESER